MVGRVGAQLLLLVCLNAQLLVSPVRAQEPFAFGGWVSGVGVRGLLWVVAVGYQLPCPGARKSETTPKDLIANHKLARVAAETAATAAENRAAAAEERAVAAEAATATAVESLERERRQQRVVQDEAIAVAEARVLAET